jgi:hypothetical protein
MPHLLLRNLVYYSFFNPEHIWKRGRERNFSVPSGIEFWYFRQYPSHCLHLTVLTPIGEVKFALEQAMKSQKRSTSIALLFLQLRC